MPSTQGSQLRCTIFRKYQPSHYLQVQYVHLSTLTFVTWSTIFLFTSPSSIYRNIWLVKTKVLPCTCQSICPQEVAAQWLKLQNLKSSVIFQPSKNVQTVPQFVYFVRIEYYSAFFYEATTNVNQKIVSVSTVSLQRKRNPWPQFWLKQIWSPSFTRLGCI